MQCPLYCSNFPELKQSKQSSYFRCLRVGILNIINVAAYV
jgi:hypothetical protein